MKLLLFLLVLESWESQLTLKLIMWMQSTPLDMLHKAQSVRRGSQRHLGEDEAQSSQKR